MKTGIPVPAVWFPAIRAGTGADVFTERLATGLRERGIRVEVSWLPHRAEYLPWTVPPPMQPEWANIVHVNTWLHPRFIPAGMPLLATMHHCVHEPELGRYKSKLQKVYHEFWIRPIERRVLERAARVVAVSHYTAEQTRKSFGCDGIEVIYNGLPSLAGHRPFVARSPGSPFRLLYVGTWSRRKGSDLLAPIMEALGEKYELWFTSEEGRKTILPTNCRALGRPSNEELDELYRSCDALLFPSRLEGFGQVVLEAMARGLPVIATNGSALPEVMRDGLEGFLCTRDDVPSFVSAVRRMSTDSQSWSGMRVQALRRSRNFSLDSMVDAYLATYSELLSDDAGINRKGLVT